MNKDSHLSLISKLVALLAFFMLTSTIAYAQATNIILTKPPENAFSARADPAKPITFRNPVISGFNSDPSICRVGADYYMVSSTFEYFPGVPLYHSKDLVNWELIGHCITRPTQLPGELNIYATTLRYHDGIFYMITTNTGVEGNFYVTATNPAGPWTDPVFIQVKAIDPDLFFDDDNKAYVISSTFELFEIEIKTGKLLSEGKKVWNGTGGRYPEGPHIYKKDGFYYLMAAEGGTEEAHSETIARSKYIWGPYSDNPANPILTHVNAAAQGNPIQGVGHADITQAHDGSWWMIFHGYRTVTTGVHHIIGRETFLAPVSWPTNGWPVVNGNGTVTLEMTAPTLPLKPFAAKPSRIDFDKDKLDLEWNYLRYPTTANYSSTARKGFLRLIGSAQTIEDQKSPTFMGRRVRDLYFTASTQLYFNPSKPNEEAGITLLNNGSHFDLLIKESNGGRILFSRLRFGDVVYESKPIILKPGPVTLSVKGEKSSLIFSYAQGNDSIKAVQNVQSKFISSETVGGFSGLYVGLYATGNKEESTSYADYDWFEYVADSIPKN
jgi:xylan 1,4-beta-xylosidase